MEINIFYSKKDAKQQKAAALVRRAVKNLGISARIYERESQLESPRVVVDGFDLIAQPGPKQQVFSYDLIEQALEQTAW